MSDHDHAPDDAMQQLGVDHEELEPDEDEVDFDLAIEQEREAVRRGIALLDENRGRRWRDKINWDFLNMADDCGCVLGQLDGDYWSGMCHLMGLAHRPDFGSVEWAEFVDYAAEHGFDLPDHAELAYGDLRTLWLEEVGIPT